MAKRFSILANKDAGAGYARALLDAGYERVPDNRDADFLLIDCEHAGGVRKVIGNFLTNKPVFIYPHSPLAYFIWDGHYAPLPVQCNFVIGEAARLSLAAYGYSHRVEMCGWNRCEIQAFTPTSGRRLLFVPARTRGDGKYTNQAYAEMTPKAFQFVLDHREAFDHVVVCYVRDFVNEQEYAGTGIEFVKTNPRQAVSPTLDMLRRIEEADLVISCETVACLAVARGKPTVVYNAKAVPATGYIPAAQYERYRQYYEFPLALEDMSLQDILNVCRAPDPNVEQWKRMNIGEPFDAGKFLAVIQEHVQ